MCPWGTYTTWLAYKIFYGSSIKILKFFWFPSSAKIFYLLIKYTTNKIGDSRIKGENCVVYQKKKMKLWVHILEPWVHILILITPVIFLNIKLTLWFYTSMKGMELDKKMLFCFSPHFIWNPSTMTSIGQASLWVAESICHIQTSKYKLGSWKEFVLMCVSGCDIDLTCPLGQQIQLNWHKWLKFLCFLKLNTFV